MYLRSIFLYEFQLDILSHLLNLNSNQLKTLSRKNSGSGKMRIDEKTEFSRKQDSLLLLGAVIARCQAEEDKGNPLRFEWTFNDISDRRLGGKHSRGPSDRNPLYQFMFGKQIALYELQTPDFPR